MDIVLDLCSLAMEHMRGNSKEKNLPFLQKANIEIRSRRIPVDVAWHAQTRSHKNEYFNHFE